MKRILFWPAALLMAALIAGCGGQDAGNGGEAAEQPTPNPRKVAYGEMISIWRDVAAALQTARDPDSAKAAAATIEPLVKRMQEFHEKAKEFGAMSSKESASLSQEFSDMKALMLTMAEEHKRIVSDQALKEPMAGILETLKSVNAFLPE